MSQTNRLPNRWIVEPSIAWPKFRRRLAKDWENFNCNALRFVKLVSICLKLRRF